MAKSSDVELTCGVCGKLFKRRKAEFNRSSKMGRPSFCSRTCTGKHNAGNFGDARCTDTSHLRPDNRKDDFTGTGFKEALRRVRNRQKETNLTLEYLQKLWEQQDGKCAYSGVRLSHALHTWKATRHKHKQPPKHLQASLDRIDSSKPYEQGNVQFVSVLLNYAKSDLSDAEFRLALKELGFNFTK